MAYPVALRDLIRRVYQRTNLEGAVAFMTTPEVIDNINGSTAEWVDEVRGCTWAGQYWRRSHTMTVGPALTSDPFQVALPLNFVSMTSVDVYLSPSQVISATVFQEEDRNLFRGSVFGWFGGQPIRYAIWEQNIAFNPAPQSVFTVKLNYVPTAPTLNRPDDTIDSINGLEEFIVLDAGIKCLMKMGETTMIPVLQARLEQQRERIRAMVPRRDMGQAEMVHEIAGDDSGMGGW